MDEPSSEHFDAFGRGRLKDIWRNRNPDLRDYTWYSTRGKNGFRLDHVFATTEVGNCIVRAGYIHEIRTRGLSDHSALLVELSAPAGTTGDHNLGNIPFVIGLGERLDQKWAAGRPAIRRTRAPPLILSRRACCTRRRACSAPSRTSSDRPGRWRGCRRRPSSRAHQDWSPS